MANHHTKAARLDSEGLTRRNLLMALPVAGVAVAIPALAKAAEPVAVPVIEKAPVREERCITSLPFVRDTTRAERRGGMPPRIFWDVKPSGDYAKDCDTGDRYARLALDYMASQNFTPLLGWAVFDMMRNGPEHSGIEVGFLSVFGHNATAAEKIRQLARMETMA